ncbi:MAG TPA: hypothetical protein VFX67_04495 [Burkholderiales bacterium]|nr:hypothetical protein [Burkholderiales bacterium]
MTRSLLLALLVSAAPLCSAYEVNGVTLGVNEKAVKKAFPSAYCKPLEWRSDAADRQCDDAKITYAGIRARVTFYLQRDAVQAFTVRFGINERERIADHFRSRWGAPTSETTQSISRKERDPKQVTRVRWDRGNDHALLTAYLDRKRGMLEVWRGNFIDEIYRVR